VTNSATTAVGADRVGAAKLAEFQRGVEDLTLAERQEIVDQALVLLEQLYVHLPLKRAMHAVEPIQRLKLLRYRTEGSSERAFHDEMSSIFVGLRDLHTNYLLPALYQTRTAFLPFRLQEFAPERRHYLVSETMAGFQDESFVPGVEVTHWNGIPIDRAVELNAERQAGSNPAARHAQGLDNLTIRWLGISPPPDEEWVVIRYLSGAERREIAFEWQVFEPEPAPTGVRPDDARDPRARALGIDARREAVRRTQKALFAPEAMELEHELTAAGRAGPAEGPAGQATVSAFPDVLQFQAVATPHGDYGHLRIRTFNVDDVDAFVGEVVRILELLPQDGLILDVRGNGGGVIMAGEQLLQLFTPRAIEPERLHFVNTPLTLELVSAFEDLVEWRPSIAQAVETGSPFSDGFPIVPGHAEDCNRLGQRYHGPVVLLIDPLCYSTTDIFAAGFQDHAVGPILGTGGNTGAGGANVWEHGLLTQVLPPEVSSLRPLPNGVSFRVAIRRTSRVGERAGDPVEDLGVIPDRLHALTREDLLQGNPDLLNHAGEILAGLPVRSLSAEIESVGDTSLSAAVTTQGIARLDAYVGNRPRATLDVEDGTTRLEVEVGRASDLLELRGYDGDVLVASRRIVL
jgi:hypothetical protein